MAYGMFAIVGEDRCKCISVMKIHVEWYCLCWEQYEEAAQSRTYQPGTVCANKLHLSDTHTCKYACMHTHTHIHTFVYTHAFI